MCHARHQDLWYFTMDTKIKLLLHITYNSHPHVHNPVLLDVYIESKYSAINNHLWKSFESYHVASWRDCINQTITAIYSRFDKLWLSNTSWVTQTKNLENVQQNSRISKAFRYAIEPIVLDYFVWFYNTSHISQVLANQQSFFVDFFLETVQYSCDSLIYELSLRVQFRQTIIHRELNLHP